MVAKDLVSTMVDILPSLGKPRVAKADSLPRFQLNYSEFGFSDLRAETILNTIDGMCYRLDECSEDEFDRTLGYLIMKAGYDADSPDHFEDGLDVIANKRFLVVEENTSAKPFYCQATAGESEETMEDCLYDFDLNFRDTPVIINTILLAVLVIACAFTCCHNLKIKPTTNDEKEENMLNRVSS